MKNQSAMICRELVVLGMGVAIAFIATACGTVTPERARDIEPSYDETTPKQYPPASSGYIETVRNDKGEVVGALITEGARKRYNTLISWYAIQYRNETGKPVEIDAGIRPHKDRFGNDVYFIDAEHLEAFVLMNLKSKADDPHDSIMEKIKESISP